MKSYYEITLMHLLPTVTFAHCVQKQCAYFIAIANDREITQKKQKPGPNTDDIDTAIVCRNEKVQIV